MASYSLLFFLFIFISILSVLLSSHHLLRLRLPFLLFFLSQDFIISSFPFSPLPPSLLPLPPGGAALALGLAWNVSSADEGALSKASSVLSSRPASSSPSPAPSPSSSVPPQLEGKQLSFWEEVQEAWRNVLAQLVEAKDTVVKGYKSVVQPQALLLLLPPPSSSVSSFPVSSSPSLFLFHLFLISFLLPILVCPDLRISSSSCLQIRELPYTLLPPPLPAPMQKPITVLVDLELLLSTRQFALRTGSDYFLQHLAQMAEVVVVTNASYQVFSSLPLLILP